MLDYEPAMQSLQSIDVEPCAELPLELRKLATRGIIHSYPKKTQLISEGDIGDSLFIILKGSVKVFSLADSGREITYGKVLAGDYFGEMSLDGGMRSASVTTLESTICAVLSRDVVATHLSEFPEFAFNLVVHAIRRARAATEVARKMALLDVYGRLVSVLEEQGGGVATELGTTMESITHREIASRVGASREMVSRLLKDLEKGGYIEMRTKHITLLKKLPSRW